MLKTLSINNFAIIDNINLDFPSGLNIITGETGAGKSILLGALGLILGERADLKSFYNQEDKCIVEAEFEIKEYDLKEFFEEEDLDYEDSILVRREILPNGKSRAFINDTPVNLKSLQSLSSRLIDVHQQFDTLSIQHEDFQRDALDALARNKEALKEYKAIYNAYTSDKKKLEQLKESLQKQTSENDYLKFTYEELEAAKITPGIQASLEEELNILENAELIKKNLVAATYNLTESERSLIQQLREVNFLVSAVSKYDKRIEDILQRLSEITPEIQDISATLEQIAENTEISPERIEDLQSHLSNIYKLLKKHNVLEADELIAIRDNLATRLEGSLDLEDQMITLKKRIEENYSKLLEKGKNISTGRSKAASFLEKNVHEMLAVLNMPHARIKTEFIPLTEPNQYGLEQIKILFNANKGSVPAEIKSVASGGELSRLALCMQSLVASSIPLPTMIFDEIDAGVSGSISLQMGNILRKLSDKHQVIVITHSPQVAAKADKHFYVYKEVVKNQTYTKVRILDSEQRIYNIASMLSTDPPSQAAMANARELIEN